MRIGNNSKSTVHVELTLHPGAVIEVDDELGPHLLAQGLVDAGDYDVAAGIPEGELAELQALAEAEVAAEVAAAEAELAEANSAEAGADAEVEVTAEAVVDEDAEEPKGRRGRK